ncbi:DUF3992 domain-containing protein [Metabacillus iocasae]|uniref:Endospore appendages core domain-containing protein n=1 Tax=Priestia iocasae TaxID=2291674 RepID=A0ABS2QUS4_9BACI|nr:S-Ena type endospore appendage [Metabacillus iocasae]MBM7702948.1 hypothetical protein [Metabacillus iocasae]
MANLGKCYDSTCCVNDAVCCTMNLTTGESTTIWENETSFVVNGTVMIENNGSPGTPSASLFVNGASANIVVGPGECRSVTLNNLELIVLNGVGGTGTASIKVSFSLNYKY